MNIKTFEELLSTVKTKGLNIPSFVQKVEAEFLEIPVSVFRQRILKIYNIMKAAVNSGLSSNELSKSGLSGENTAILKACAGNANVKHFSLFSSFQKKVMLYSLSVIEENARMGKVAACPTAGSSGIVPGVLIALEEELKLDKDTMINALIVAGIVGEIVSEKMALAGAVAGCQAECGVASAMAASSAAYILGGSGEQILNAAALALKNILGLTCDPVAGLVEVPCVKRNVFLSIHALTAAELSLSGIESKIPVDEIVDAMKETGDLMSTRLKESSEAGLANTGTGVMIENVLRQKFCE